METVRNRKKFNIGRLTVDLIKEAYQRIKREKNCDAIGDFYIFLPPDLIRAAYQRYIKKETCFTFYTIDGHCFCEKSGHFISFPRTLVKNFFCNNGKPNSKELSLGVLADYVGCTEKENGSRKNN